MTAQLPVAEDLFRWSGGGAALVGSRCRGCGSHYFPKCLSCRNPDCTDKAVDEVLLGRRGVLRSYAVQAYRPPALFRMEPSRPTRSAWWSCRKGCRCWAC
ncbi:MAG: uncharacterized protein QOI51_2564 [Nocardioidaceae bacterium]|nr:uncharacterized protein [Nocardioidaceae bacterium]